MIRRLIFATVIILGGHVQAQDLFDVGLKGGISQDRISLQNVPEYSSVTGWHAGLFARVKPPLAPGAQVELLYNTMGADILRFDTIDGEASIRLHYLQLPAFLVFSLGPAEIHLGGYGSYLLGSTIRQPLAVADEVEQLRSDQFMDVDYGLLGGLGFKLGSIYLGARYTLGLGTVGAEDNNILRNSRNMQGQLFIGIGFK